MNVFTPEIFGYQGLTHLGFGMTGGRYYSSELTRVAASQQQQSDITILTAEGDKVTLSSSLESRADLVTYSSLGRTMRGVSCVQGRQLSLEGSNNMVIQVEGDLSEEELRDIKKTVRLLDKVMKDVASGDMEQALSKAQKAANFDSILGVEAKMEFQQTLSVEQVSHLEVAAPIPETINVPATDSDQPVSAIDQENRLTDLILDLIRQSGVKKGKLLKPIRQLMHNHLKPPLEEDQSNISDPGRAERIHATLLEKIEAIPEMDEDSQPMAEEWPLEYHPENEPAAALV